jgi:hypothetical protein
MTVIPHTLYPSDLTTCDFFIFPKIKIKLKGRRVNTTEGIQAKLQRVLDTNRKELPGSIPKMQETVGPVVKCRRVLL